MKYKTTMLVLLVLTIGIFGLSNIANTLQRDVKITTEATHLSQVNAVAPATTCNNAPATSCAPVNTATPVVVPEADNDNDVMITPISRYIILQ